MAHRILDYIDEANRLDRELNVIGELAEGVLDAEILGQRSVSDLGTLIQNYVKRARALRGFFLEQSTDLEDTAMQSELARLRILHPKTERSEEESLLGNETRELQLFAENILSTPAWRRVSLTEFLERCEAVVIKAEKSEQTVKPKFLVSILKASVQIVEDSYRHEFGHSPFHMMEDGPKKTRLVQQAADKASKKPKKKITAHAYPNKKKKK